MALKRAARDVLPSTAMAAVDECLLLKGVQPTDAFALALWYNLLSWNDSQTLWRSGDMRVVYELDTERVRKVTKQVFIIRLENKQRFLRVERFFATADGLVRMSAFIKECRELAACGMCPCENPPKRLKLAGFDGCGVCFLKE